MLYPFISYPDGTEIVHSEIYFENALPVVRVEIEQPDNKSEHFKSIQMILPKGDIKQSERFTEKEIQYYKKLILQLSDVIFDNAKDNMNLYK